ncbi:MAG TPA: SDR family NAD(P)-dependent oxidoreductase [Stellaceae bacterium]|nr:SDR family NAD(P)-dependent oxidoreductase [Stellaceae bacterium]
MNRDADWLGLAGRICVVTGAGSGIGRAVATAMVGAGAVVALLDRDRGCCEAAAAELRGRGGRALAIECDTADPASVGTAAEDVQRAFAACDVLVNNAGLLRSGALESLSLEDWNHLLGVNLTGYLLCAQAFGKPMLAARRGSIVHVASVAAHHPQPRSGAYSVSKAGVAILSRQLALEWGPSGIRSNVVSPGLVRTPLSEAFYQAPGVSERRAQAVPSRRIGTPEDIADVVLFLASDRAAYVNGADVAVDGGFAAVLMDTVPRPGF